MASYSDLLSGNDIFIIVFFAKMLNNATLFLLKIL